jgi:CRISPR-associated endonuclease/helicase Cas3
MKSFDQAFEAIFRVPPFPWQRALYARFAAGDIPQLVDLPTGLGKTSIVAIWLLALNAGANVPRRLVYVVNRRTVVDQTTREVERLLANLGDAGASTDIAVSTLRGQHVDNRAWSADPSRPAVICGTVDMIGSRLLFSGYGASFRTKPLYAGFLGQDALIVHDEAHLEPAFQTLLERVEAEQHRCGDPWPMRLMALTATSRSNGTGSAFGLGPEDREHVVVKQRVFAKKALHLHSCGGGDLVDVAAAKALTYLGSGRAVLVFLRTVADLAKMTEAIRKGGGASLRVLAGTMRGFERERLVASDPVFQRFLPPGDRDPTVAPADGTVYLVSTSAGEVGVNLSADHLVCDLSTFDSMTQRFGRVNRFGSCTDTEVHVFCPELFNDDRMSVALERTLAILTTLDGDASPAALAGVGESTRRAGFTPEPKILRLDEIVLDAFSLTSVRGELPGRPDVAQYLHGIAEWEPPQTRVAWRDEVELLRRRDETSGRQTLSRALRPDDLLDDYPLKPHEWLTDNTSRVVETLYEAVARAPDLADLDVWLVRQGGVTVSTLREALGRDKKDGETALREATLILPAFSMRPVDGFLRPESDGSDGSCDVSEIPGSVDGGPERRRVRSDDPQADGGAPHLRRIRTIVLHEPSDDSEADGGSDTVDENTERPITEGRFWVWLESPASADNEGSRSGRKAVRLDVHLADVEREARRICERLPLSSAQKEAVALAGAFHDLGKCRLTWQRSIGNRVPPPLLAKGGPSAVSIEGSRYRHELGSIIDAATDARFSALDADHQDLVLQLVAAHHGRARPHFPKDELFDTESPSVDIQHVGLETLRRFARLQRKHGRWGLAYLESLLRAADYAASANPSKEET